MSKGRIKEPPEMKVLKGGRLSNDDKKSISATKKITNINAPDYLDDFSKKIWYKKIRELSNYGIMSDSFVEALGVFCFHQGQFEKIAREFKDGKNTDTVISINKSGNEYEAISPKLLVLNIHRKNAIELSREFGFTPSSFTKVASIIEENNNDGNDEFENLLGKLG